MRGQRLSGGPSMPSVARKQGEEVEEIGAAFPADDSPPAAREPMATRGLVDRDGLEPGALAYAPATPDLACLSESISESRHADPAQASSCFGARPAARAALASGELGVQFPAQRRASAGPAASEEYKKGQG